LETCSQSDFERLYREMNPETLEDAIALVNDYTKRRVLEDWHRQIQTW